MSENKKYCSRCVLPSTTPLIEFDENGVCNYCRDHPALTYKGEEEFVRQLDKFRDKNRKYECVVALSGGRDSAFTLLKLVKDYKMKVLAVNYDNPFAHPRARANIQNAVSLLNVDLITVKARRDLHQKIWRDNLKTWIKRPSPQTLYLMCVACKLMWYEIIKVALKNKVYCIVSGNNRYEDISYAKALLGIDPKVTWEKAFKKSFYGIVSRMLRSPGYFKPAYWTTYFKAYVFGDTYAIGTQALMRKLTFLDLFYYIPWNEREVLSRIKSELKWEPPPDIPSSWRFDCRIAPIKDLVNLTFFGVTEKDGFYSKMIRDGLMTRDEALKRLETENKVQRDKAREILAEAGIEYNDFVEKLEKHSELRARLKLSF